MPQPPRPCRLLHAGLLMLASLPLWANERVVTIGTGEWPPYVVTTASHFGPIGEVIVEVFASQGYDVRFVDLPWNRAFMMLSNGEIHGLMPAYCSKERGQVYHCSDTIMEGKQVLFHRRTLQFDWVTEEDLADLSIGATLGYFYGDRFGELEASNLLNVIRTAKDETNVRLLSRGLIDIYPQDVAVGYSLISTLLDPDDSSNLTHHPRPLHTESLHLLFRRDTEGQQLLNYFNSGLTQLRDDGQLNMLLESLLFPAEAMANP